VCSCDPVLVVYLWCKAPRALQELHGRADHQGAVRQHA
jgi:hypothetical protein